MRRGARVRALSPGGEARLESGETLAAERTLLATVTRNAEQSLARHKVARAGDLTSRTRALNELQEALGLDEAPLRIECFDISHTMGEATVAACVVFDAAGPVRSQYRRYNIATGGSGAGHAVLG